MTSINPSDVPTRATNDPPSHMVSYQLTKDTRGCFRRIKATDPDYSQWARSQDSRSENQRRYNILDRLAPVLPKTASAPSDSDDTPHEYSVEFPKDRDDLEWIKNELDQSLGKRQWSRRARCTATDADYTVVRELVNTILIEGSAVDEGN